MTLIINKFGSFSSRNSGFSHLSSLGVSVSVGPLCQHPTSMSTTIFYIFITFLKILLCKNRAKPETYIFSEKR
jgi:hypothetical protein